MSPFLPRPVKHHGDVALTRFRRSCSPCFCKVVRDGFGGSSVDFFRDVVERFLMERFGETEDATKSNQLVVTDTTFMLNAKVSWALPLLCLGSRISRPAAVARCGLYAAERTSGGHATLVHLSSSKDARPLRLFSTSTTEILLLPHVPHVAPLTSCVRV